MVLRLMEEGRPLTHCVMYDTGMEFDAIYRNLELISPILRDYGCELTVLKPEMHYLEYMLIKPVNKGKDTERYGYDWCGGPCRWGTGNKVRAIDRYVKGLVGESKQYIGIASDEPKRIKDDPGTIYPLVEWGMTEADCLRYCYDRGWHWREGDVELYELMDRVSCWCCCNKNLKELKNMYLYLPDYWARLKGLQSRIDRPFRRDGKTVFDLQTRFQAECMQ